MTSLCSDASSSISTRRRQPHEDPSWERMNDEFQMRKEKGSVFSASPWEREEKEKLQREQVLDARRARDQEIAYLESIEERSEKQEEWLRILRLEREFQRRAEQELDEEEEGSVGSENSDTDSEQAEIFHGDKLTAIPNERIGIKLLDELLENSSKCSTVEKSNGERELPHKSPSEKHFIPLELTIPDRDLHQPSSLPITNNILQVSEQNSDSSGNRLSKPPIPAPRPSKAFTVVPPLMPTKYDSSIQEHDRNSELAPESSSDSKPSNTNVSSLTKLEISDSSAFFCATENGNDRGREIQQQDNWLIEVNSFESSSFQDRDDARLAKQNSDSKEESRIYENIKPMDYQSMKVPPKNGFGSHTLPKTTSNGNLLSNSKDPLSARNGGGHFEKKFPTMGITSTLTKKLNGFSACDSDILPALYATSKTRNGYAREIPSDLADKSPEFKKLWISRPEKLTFQDKIRKFSLQAGEDDVPRDRVKNSRAQREIENKFSEGQKKLPTSVET